MSPVLPPRLAQALSIDAIYIYIYCIFTHHMVTTVITNLFLFYFLFCFVCFVYSVSQEWSIAQCLACTGDCFTCPCAFHISSSAFYVSHITLTLLLHLSFLSFRSPFSLSGACIFHWIFYSCGFLCLLS